MPEELFKQGAEAKLYLEDYNGQQCLVKERFPKKYRHPTLDNQITKERMRAESKAVTRCTAAGVRVPKVFQMDLNTRKVHMEYFEKSITAKDFINQQIVVLPEAKCNAALDILCSRIGEGIGKMHKNHIIHGDLTTSNFLIDPKSEDFSDYELVFIDFGLSHYSESVEDKGVDLYVLERALLSTHSNIDDLFPKILKKYEEEYSEESKEVIARFEEVRARGRKRTMIG